jgi:hypothetical protein
MTDTEEAQDLTTEQITPGTRAYDRDSPQWNEPVGHADTEQPSDGPTDEEHVQLFEAAELQTVIARWREIQAGFVDEPRQAVKEADALVADLIQRLTRTFANERAQLETRWSGGDEVSTEDLRQGLRRYRSFFERLLAA